MPNEFSAAWFDTFLSPATLAPVDRELAFVEKHLPLREFGRLLDVPCGIGRHASALAALGYDVVGVDRDGAAIDQAQATAPPGVSYRVGDMADLDDLPSDFDAVLCLWQSFGFGTDDENLETLAKMGRRVRPGGRFLLDIYNAEALKGLPGETTRQVGERTVRTRQVLQDGRLQAHISYSDRPVEDHYDWRVYTPSELMGLASAAGLKTLFACAWFDAEVAPSPEHRRMQMLFEGSSHPTP
ncbi:MAG: class I SAM-dependent methyltransferase [Longimicrobiales bacterium]